VNVLVAHNFYQVRGGEDQIFEDVATLLDAGGHRVSRFAVHNDDLAGTGKLAMAKMTVWNGSLAKRIREIVRRDKIELVHFINTFPQISPAAYYAARRAGAAVVQEVQNFRLSCPAALFLRDGKVCEDCLGKAIPWPAVRHGCYRGSRSATAVVSSMLVTHRLLGTYRKSVDAYIATTAFGKAKLVEAGLPDAKTFIKPNFVSPDPGPGAGNGGYALFVGRLSKEKGIDVLLRAWEQNIGVPLKILGDGPMADQVKAAAARLPNVEWLGRKPVDEVMQIMGDASCLIFPSVWYEGLPKTIIESLAKGTPIIASKIGAMIELIDHAKTGLHVTPGDSDSLAQAVLSLFAYPDTMRAMRVAAREAFLDRYTADENNRQLIRIYEQALAIRHGRAAFDDDAAGVSLPPG